MTGDRPPLGVCGYEMDGTPIGPHDDTGQGRCECGQTLDPFAGPTEAPVEPTRVKPGEMGEWIWLDRGRYSAPHPETGKRRTWQRATNAIKPLDDTYMLDRFGERHVALGMAQRPALCARAAALTTDAEHRDELQEIADRAKDHAGASDGADRGTAMHTWTARMDAGRPVDPYDVPDGVMDDLIAYENALVNAGLAVHSEYIERTTCIPELGIMGTFDRLFGRHPGKAAFCDVCPSDVLHVGDLKTGQHEIAYGQVKASQQFALYAMGSHLVNATRDGWEPAPAICPHVGVLMHLLIGSGECELYRVDMVRGAELLQLSLAVTEARKTKNLLTPWGNA